MVRLRRGAVTQMLALSSRRARLREVERRLDDRFRAAVVVSEVEADLYRGSSVRPS